MEAMEFYQPTTLVSDTYCTQAMKFRQQEAQAIVRYFELHAVTT